MDDARSVWGAAKNTNPRPVSPRARIGISWHHDGAAPLNLASRAHGACLTRVKAVQRFHQSAARGWADIGYNLFVCQHGRVIEGRGVDLQGAHSPGVNVQHYGIQFMVGGSEPPTPAAFARAASLARELATHSGRALRQWGHRDDPQVSTECPGDYLESWVKRQGMAQPTAPAPATKPSTPMAPSVRGVEIVVKNVRPNARNEDVRKFNALLWEWVGPTFRARWNARWMSESANLYGPIAQQVTQAAYAALAEREPKNFDRVTLPCWPGARLVERMGGVAK